MTSGPAADAFTLQVIQGSMTSTVREMMRTTKASAHSTVFAEGEDFTCAIADPRGRLTFQAEGLGLHAATFPAAIELVLAQYDSFRPGDVFFHNDPYGGGAHQADGAFARPVFHGDELVAWVANRGHWSDVGGMSAGGWAGSATHVLQEALFVPPVRLVKAGELDDELARLVLANVRNADDAWGTIQSQLASLETAAARICSTVDRYGLDAFRAATDAYLEYTRKRFLVGLRALPDGEWSAEDFLDDDGAGAGPLRIALTVRKDGERISVDFDGTDRQARGPANTSFVNTRSAVLVVMLSLVDPDLPLNSGWFDLVEISAPRGTLVNPVYPAPMFHGTGAPMPRVFDLVLRALAQAVPDRVTAASYGTGTVVVVAFVDEETGDERSWMHYTGGGGGARATSDGLDGVWWTLANCKLESIELVEQRFPLLFEGEGWQRPSAGPGRQRGGLGIERRLVLLDDARVTALNDRHKIAPWGLFGGGDGVPCTQRVRSDGREGRFDELFGVASPSKFANVPLRRGDRLVLASGGGGGYGPPFERDPDAVLRDVREGHVSVGEAERLYGVAVSGDPPALDAEATARLRGGRA